MVHAPKTLYALTVFCTIFSLRVQGQKIHPDHIRESGIDGWLFVGRASPVSPPETHAWVKDQDCTKYPRGKDLLPQLRHARISKIERGGMLLIGQEQDYLNNVTYKQSWWVVPKTPPAEPSQHEPVTTPPHAAPLP